MKRKEFEQKVLNELEKLNGYNWTVDASHKDTLEHIRCINTTIQDIRSDITKLMVRLEKTQKKKNWKY